MKFPYGLSDFRKLITGGYFFIDRTDHLPQIEELGRQLLFLRPRRFGKSLLLSMLAYYYDVNYAAEFEQLFGHLTIGKNPTPLHNQYLVMHWDFSMVQSHGEVTDIERSLNSHLNTQIRLFTHRYHDRLALQVEIDPVDGTASLQSALAAIQESPHQLYLLIDEYDNFANEVLMDDSARSQERYEAMLYGDGMFKSLFKVVKGGATGRGLDRVLIAGVSPIVLSDATSGYNVARNVSLEPALHDLCGFWEAEISETLEQITAECAYPPEKAQTSLASMRSFYNGYAFTYAPPALVYNPTLALYYFDHFQRHCEAPRTMLDSNFASDRNKIAYIARRPGGKALILDAIEETSPVSVQQLEDRFGMVEMLEDTQDRTFMASLLYYLGVLTLGPVDPASGRLTLRIPNLVVRKLYVERLRDLIMPDQRQHDLIEQMAGAVFARGELQPLCDFIEKQLFRVLDNRDYRWANEMTLKTAFLTLLFNETFYVIDSEAAVDRSYADLVMILRPEMRRYQLLDLLMEFKMVRLGEAGLTAEQARSLSQDDLLALPAIQARLEEARNQLTIYQAGLQVRYGETLRLHSYAVISLGFERLFWEEVSDNLPQ